MVATTDALENQKSIQAGDVITVNQNTK